jgi:hypothetical protein
LPKSRMVAPVTLGDASVPKRMVLSRRHFERNRSRAHVDNGHNWYRSPPSEATTVCQRAYSGTSGVTTVDLAGGAPRLGRRLSRQGKDKGDDAFRSAWVLQPKRRRWVDGSRSLIIALPRYCGVKAKGLRKACTAPSSQLFAARHSRIRRPHAADGSCGPFGCDIYMYDIWTPSRSDMPR